MIKTFTDKFIQDKDLFRDEVRKFVEKNEFYDHDEDTSSNPSYKNLFKLILNFLGPIKIDQTVYEIDQGSLKHLRSEDQYEGDFLLFFKADSQYGASKFFYSALQYGSCSVCDTFENAIEFGKDIEEKVDGLMSLSLHMVQSIRIVNTLFDVKEVEEIEQETTEDF